MENPKIIEETENEIISKKGRNIEVKFKKGLSSDEFDKWMKENNLIPKEED